jgi:uncharacterized iron-regulated membrane protein
VKSNFFLSMAWLHTWFGLVVGWLLFAIFLTGTLAVFDHEISFWMQPELQRAGPQVDVATSTKHALRLLQQTASQARFWRIDLPSERTPTIRAEYLRDGRFTGQHLDPATGAVVTPRQTMGGEFFYRFHYRLHLGDAGIWIVGAAGMAMLTILVSGVIIHRRIFRDFFTFRPFASAHRAWLDAHNALGVLALPFHIMITYTGVVVFYTIYMPAGIDALYGSHDAYFDDIFPRAARAHSVEPAPLTAIEPLIAEAEMIFGGDVRRIVIRDAGRASALIELYSRFDDRLRLFRDRVYFDGITGARDVSQTEFGPAHLTQSVMAGLHLIQFGGDVMRWLYFILGLASSAMIATGLLLFTRKRRARDAGAAAFYDIVDRLNIAAIAGVCMASIALLWANRLLPVDMALRAGWEMTAFFAVWLASLMHAWLRGPNQAWRDQLRLAAALCLALPLLNALTSTAHLGVTLPAQDWMVASVDLSVFGIGVLLAAVAARLGHKPT